MPGATATPEKRGYRMVARAEAAAATRSRLLEAAWRHFSERAFDDVRLADVARDAGVSAQTLHNHFGTKDALFVAAWQWTMAPEGARRDSAAPGDVGKAIRVLYDSYDKDGDAVLRLLAQEERIPAVREMADAGRRWHRGWVKRTFEPRSEERLVALIVATDLLTWKLLRREMGLGRRQAERIVTGMVTSLKGAP